MQYSSCNRICVLWEVWSNRVASPSLRRSPQHPGFFKLLSNICAHIFQRHCVPAPTLDLYFFLLFFLVVSYQTVSLHIDFIHQIFTNSYPVENALHPLEHFQVNSSKWIHHLIQNGKWAKPRIQDSCLNKMLVINWKIWNIKPFLVIIIKHISSLTR